MDQNSLPEKILQRLESEVSLDTLGLAREFGEDHQKIVGATKSLQVLDGYINVESITTKKLELTSEGEKVCQDGSYEFIIYSLIPPEGILKDDLPQDALSKIGFSTAMKNRWIKLDDSRTRVIRIAEGVQDVVREHLQLLKCDPEKVPESSKKEYKKRKLIQEITTKYFALTKGPEFKTTLPKLETDLTAEMLADGSWENAQFKPLNFEAMGFPLPFGNLHPLLKVRSEFRKIFLRMGFSEMDTRHFVESSFWNFDALFQPQQHPARDAHDTFYVSYPETSNDIPESYMKKVKEVHETGGYGSIGYDYEWSLKEAKKNVLRTHTTAVSARLLYKIGQEYANLEMRQAETSSAEPESKPEYKTFKYFSIDRVFRNETLDATHLAEFHQVEGVVGGPDINLAMLMGIMGEFYKQLGLERIQFKPAYNPYTEPSMEIFAYHKGLGKLIEIGNSGMFRREMLSPMGIPEEINVIAWGLSLERPTMIKYGVNNIRDLVGHKINLQKVNDSPICLF